MTSFLPVSEVRGDDGCAVYQSLQGTYAGAAGQDFTYIATESDSGKTGLTMKGYLTEFIKEAQVHVLEAHNGIAETMTMGLTGSIKGVKGLFVGAKVTA